MAREGRSVYKMLWNNFINSLKPRQFRGNLVGKDYMGNQYYEIPKSDTNRKLSRWFVPKDGDESNFDKGLPAEWEAWLRQRRKHPPTDEEVMANLELMKSKQEKALALEKKFKGQSEPPKQASTFPKYEDYQSYKNND